MSYVMEEGDSIQSLSSRFGVSMDSIEAVNGMTGPDGIVAGDVYYIPLNSGEFPSNSGLAISFSDNLIVIYCLKPHEFF